MPASPESSIRSIDEWCGRLPAMRLKPERSVHPANVTLTPLDEQQFGLLRELAGVIWRQHYAGMIPAAQVDYMLAGRLSDEALLQQTRARDKWLWLMRASDVCVGYCGHELAPGDGVTPAAMKLGQLYVLPSHRGTGLGGFMLGHVEAQAREHGRRLLFLQVNKRNTSAIGFYRAMGFQVVREAVFDIGGGFVMDDYIMEKPV